MCIKLLSQNTGRVVIPVSRTISVSACKEINSVRKIAGSYFKRQVRYCHTFENRAHEEAFLLDMCHEASEWYRMFHWGQVISPWFSLQEKSVVAKHSIDGNVTVMSMCACLKSSWTMILTATLSFCISAYASLAYICFVPFNTQGHRLTALIPFSSPPKLQIVSQVPPLKLFSLQFNSQAQPAPPQKRIIWVRRNL